MSGSNTHPRELIPELCRSFYQLGWVTGTGGGISLKEKEEIFIAPSGVQKERIQPEDMFVYNVDGSEKSAPPAEKGYKASQCTPLFFAAYNKCEAGAVIHTHSQHAVRATLMCPGETFEITHQEMIKGIRVSTNGPRLRYFDTLVVPIIENTTHERDLKASMEAAIDKYPDACAVLVRRHGVYVWGKNWIEAKTMCECYDYLFEMAVSMKAMGMDPAERPKDHDALVAKEEASLKRQKLGE
jgi:methylthioribulose-1-phosphate dehydratase